MRRAGTDRQIKESLNMFWRGVKSLLYRSAELSYRIFPKKATLTFYCYMTYIMRAVTWRLACKYYGQAMADHRGDVPDFVLSHIMSGDSVIDVGCAEGNLTRMVARKARKVVAVEIDKKYLDMIDKSEDCLRNTVFINGNIVDLEIDEIFDTAILVHTIEHMHNSAVVLKRLSAIARKIVVETPDEKSDWITSLLGDLGIVEKGDDKHVRIYDTASLKSELEQNGWREVSVSAGGGVVRAVASSRFI